MQHITKLFSPNENVNKFCRLASDEGVVPSTRTRTEAEEQEALVEIDDIIFRVEWIRQELISLGR